MLYRVFFRLSKARAFCRTAVRLPYVRMTLLDVSKMQKKTGCTITLFKEVC